MGDQPLSAPAAGMPAAGEPVAGEPVAGTLHYATPMPRLKRIRPVPAMIGGMFLVLVAALTLLIGFGMVGRLSLSGDMEVAFAFTFCTFSAVCVFAGIPLIYRGTRAEP